jgi:hypothetical protein
MGKDIKTDILGFHPATLADVRYILDAAKEDLANFCKTFGDRVILKGLTYGYFTPFGSQYASFDSGVVYMDGEIYFTNGKVFNNITQAQFNDVGFEILESVQSPSPVMYKTSGQQSPHVLKYLDPTLNGTYKVSSFVRIEASILNLIKPLMIGDWIEVGSPGAASYVNGWGPQTGYPVSYRLDKFAQKVELKGKITGGDTLSNDVVFVLPTNYRPSTSRTFLVMGERTFSTGNSIPDFSMYRLNISSNGEVRVVAFNSTNIHQNGIVLDGVSIPL